MAGKFIFKTAVHVFIFLNSTYFFFFLNTTAPELNWVTANCVIMWLKQQIEDIAFLAIFVIFQNRRTMELGAE